MFFDFFGREHPIGCSALADRRPPLGISLERWLMVLEPPHGGGDKAYASVGCGGLDGAEQCCLCELAQCAFAGLGHGFPLINVPCKMGLLLGGLPALSVPV